MAANQGPTTPIPTKTILDLTSSVSRLGGQLDEGFGGIKERLSSLESRSPHLCNHSEMIEAVPEIKTLAEITAVEVSGLSRWRWWIMGLVTFVGGAAIAFAVNASVVGAVTSERVDQLRTDTGENTEDIENLDEQLSSVQTAIIGEVKRQGEAMQTAVKNGDNDKSIRISSVEVHKNLRPYERRQLEKLLEKANGRDR